MTLPGLGTGCAFYPAPHGDTASLKMQEGSDQEGSHSPKNTQTQSCCGHCTSRFHNA